MPQADRVVEPAFQPADHDVPHGGVAVVDVTHDTVRNQLSDFLDGTLEASEQGRVMAHLTQCRGCSAYLATLKRTADLLGQLSPRPAPGGAKARILDQVRAAS